MNVQNGKPLQVSVEDCEGVQGELPVVRLPGQVTCPKET